MSAEVRVRSPSAAERDATNASRLAYVTEETARPVGGATIRLAGQRGLWWSRCGSLRKRRLRSWLGSAQHSARSAFPSRPGWSGCPSWAVTPPDFLSDFVSRAAGPSLREPIVSTGRPSTTARRGTWDVGRGTRDALSIEARVATRLGTARAVLPRLHG